MLPPWIMLTTKNWRIASGALALAWSLGVVLTGCTPSGPRALLEGERYLQAGKLPEAIRRFETATRLLPSNAQAWNHLGLAYHQAGQSDDALKAYEQARRLDMNLTPVRYNLGCLLMEQNDPQAAVAELTSYTLLERESADGWLKLGTAQLRCRQWDSAEISFQKVLNLRPNSPEAWNGLGVLQVQRKRPKEALNCFNLALQRQPEYAPALLNLAVLQQHHLNNRPLALQKYQEYLDIHPHAKDAEAVHQAIRDLQAEASPSPRRELTNVVSNPPAPSTPRVTEPAPTPRVLTNVFVARVPAPSTAAPEPTRAKEKPVPERVASPEQSAPPELVHTPARRTESPTVVKAPVQTPPPSPVPETVAPEPKRVPDVVQVADDAPLRVAQDERARVPETVSPPIVTAPPAMQPYTVVTPRVDESVRAEPPREKKKIGERLNPSTWFKGKRRNATTPTPSETGAEPRTIAKAEVQRAPSPVGGRAPLAPSSSASTGRRYTYLTPARPAPGDRSKADPYFSEAVQAHRDRRLADAIQNYRKAATLDPSFFEAHYNLGLAAYESKDWAQSLSAYETALSINPTSANGRYNFALTLEEAGYYQDSATQLEQVIEQHPDETRAHLSLASLYAERLSRPDLARTHYRRVLELDPQHSQASAIRFWLAANP